MSTHIVVPVTKDGKRWTVEEQYKLACKLLALDAYMGGEGFEIESSSDDWFMQFVSDVTDWVKNGKQLSGKQLEKIDQAWEKYNSEESCPGELEYINDPCIRYFLPLIAAEQAETKARKERLLGH